MPQTFEELVGAEVDALYSGALFLTGGRTRAAEDLLVWTLSRAFHGFRRDGGAAGGVGRSLEGDLVEEFRNSAAGLDAYGAPDAEDDLFRAAASCEAEARAALWLVLLRRWSYADVEDCLEVDRDTLMRLLEARSELAPAVHGGGESTLRTSDGDPS